MNAESTEIVEAVAKVTAVDDGTITLQSPGLGQEPGHIDTIQRTTAPEFLQQASVDDWVQVIARRDIGSLNIISINEVFAPYMDHTKAQTVYDSNDTAHILNPPNL